LLGAHKAKSVEAIQFISSNANEATDTKRQDSVFQLDEETLKSGYGTKLEPYDVPMASIEHPSDHEQPDPDARFSAVHADLPLCPSPPRRRSSTRKSATKAAKRAARLAPIMAYPPSYFWSPAAGADDDGEEEELLRAHEAHVPGVGRTYEDPSMPSSRGSPTAGRAGRAKLAGDRGSVGRAYRVSSMPSSGGSPKNPWCIGRTYKEPSTPSTQGSPVQVKVEPESDSKVGDAVEVSVDSESDDEDNESAEVKIASESDPGEYQRGTGRRHSRVAAEVARVALREWARIEECNRLHSHLPGGLVVDDEGQVVQCDCPPLTWGLLDKLR
jgi:hypothetical protein